MYLTVEQKYICSTDTTTQKDNTKSKLSTVKKTGTNKKNYYFNNLYVCINKIWF